MTYLVPLFECVVYFWRAVAASLYIGHVEEGEGSRGSVIILFVYSTVVLFGCGYHGRPSCHSSASHASVGSHTVAGIGDQ